ncbi:hypothetical protein THASP1DRAFT_24250 [Thamnocephalis sphaerospora]|uniref:Uncharacterized protein n=1 Tax=Thamnocephalis sphaerospora TaxID=78915 RepID=A0A4P9XNR1_9FUNG|nr:hypothetical protein THASP1DRAFT_24250 [Thamnocephalis sphaerospora]|eukprot:RKP07627.1 hypothetical protein THASP1DRAFT_24250 [Thamnocephalis sphaerospora]
MRLTTLFGTAVAATLASLAMMGSVADATPFNPFKPFKPAKENIEFKDRDMKVLQENGFANVHNGLQIICPPKTHLRELKDDQNRTIQYTYYNETGVVRTAKVEYKKHDLVSRISVTDTELLNGHPKTFTIKVSYSTFRRLPEKYTMTLVDGRILIAKLKYTLTSKLKEIEFERTWDKSTSRIKVERTLWSGSVKEIKSYGEYDPSKVAAAAASNARANSLPPYTP